ncbi:MAG: hypothetical protein R6W96_08030, partial [Clostridia bacterium]
QNAYIGWLMDATAAVSVMLEDTSPRQAGRLASTSMTLYNRRIRNNLKKLLIEYEAGAILYSRIRSADYYASGHFLRETIATLEAVRKKTPDKATTPEKLAAMQEEANELEAVFFEVLGMDRVPAMLKEIPESQSASRSTGMVSALTTGDRVEYMEVRLPGGKPVRFQIFNWDIVDHFLFIGRVMQNDTSWLEEEVENLTQQIERTLQAYRKDDEAMDANIEDGSPPAVELSEDAVQMAVANKKPAKPSFFVTTMVSMAQYTIRSIQEGVDAQYEQIIRFLTSQLLQHGGRMSPEQQANVRDLITNELDFLLGGSLVDFVDVITNTSADSLIDTFQTWRDNSANWQSLQFDRSDLIALLEAYDIKVADPWAFRIVASYEALKNLSPADGNDQIMLLVYGWRDPLDYTGLRKEEKRDTAGNLTYLAYYDKDNALTGWRMSALGTSVEYTYFIPGEKDKEIRIIRTGTESDSLFSHVSTKDPVENRTTSLAMDLSKDPPRLRSITGMKDGQYDGLMMGVDGQRVGVVTYDMGKRLEAYIYKNDILVEETQNSYVGENVFSKIRIYYDNGEIRHIKSHRNGKEDGPQYSYWDNGNLMLYTEQAEGVYHGKVEHYYESGILSEFITYENGTKTGPTGANYNNEDEDMQTKFLGEYLDNKKHGVWISFTPEGRPETEAGYKEGVLHGDYRSYATGTDAYYQTIHSFGQYEDGKKVGIWLIGHNNEGYVERSYYEDGIRIWHESGNTRTYYKPDGLVDRREKIN